MNRRSFLKISLGTIFALPFLCKLGPAHASSLLDSQELAVEPIIEIGQPLTEIEQVAQEIFKGDLAAKMNDGLSHWLILLPKDVWSHPLKSDIILWHHEHGIDPMDTYRVEVNVDAMTATVYQFDRDEHGAFFLKEQRGGLYDIAVRTPFKVAVSRLPPGGYTTTWSTAFQEGLWQPEPKTARAL